MIRAAVAALGIAALLVVFLARHQEPAAARVEPPPPPAKGDRLLARAALVAPPAAPIVGAPGPADAPVAAPTAAPADRRPMSELRNLPTTRVENNPAAIVGATRESKEAAPTTVARAVGAASTNADPVCGSRGRIWYTKENGWKYWRCNR